MTTDPARILIGDTIEMMATLPAGCVQCCVTSPPYWGLRDYGTARWEGGDPACEHRGRGRAVGNNSGVRGKNATEAERKRWARNKPQQDGNQYEAVPSGGACVVCGARRVDGQIGLEESPDEFVAKMVEVFLAVRRVLRDDGTLWLNLGDSYSHSGQQMRNRNGVNPSFARPCREGVADDGRAIDSGLKPKDLCMMPWRVALALQADGWWLRSIIAWTKKSPMPESCTDRPTSAWEPIFLLTKRANYFYDAEAVREPNLTPPGAVPNVADMPYGDNNKPEMRKLGVRNGTTPCINPDGRNMRNVWKLAHEPYAEAHFATFPSEIPRRAIKAGTSEKGCCPECRAPWRRVTSRSKVTRERPADYVKREGEEGTGNSCANSVAGVSVRTLGWEPTCGCNRPDVTPCLVLDPFLGSGATVAVARELGRHGVGCELNPEYAGLARERIRKAERPVSYQDMRAPKDADAAPLFNGLSCTGGDQHDHPLHHPSCGDRGDEIRACLRAERGDKE